jgi:hypothetical protein
MSRAVRRKVSKRWASTATRDHMRLTHFTLAGEAESGRFSDFDRYKRVREECARRLVHARAGGGISPTTVLVIEFHATLPVPESWPVSSVGGLAAELAISQDGTRAAGALNVLHCGLSSSRKDSRRNASGMIPVGLVDSPSWLGSFFAACSRFPVPISRQTHRGNARCAIERCKTRSR